MKRYQKSLIVIVFASIFLMGCAKTFINTTRNRITNYWVLDSKEYQDCDAYTGDYLGGETVAFQGDSHYDFGSDNYYQGVEITNNTITNVGGYYNIINSSTIIMDYDGFNDQEIRIDVLTPTQMQLSLTYEQDGISTDETLYFFR